MAVTGRSRWPALLGVVWLVLPVACSRRALVDDAGGTGHIGADGGLDEVIGPGSDATVADVGHEVGGGAGGDGGAIACGAMICTGTDLCVETEGCGGPLNCIDATDAGGCPAGSTTSTACLSVTGRPCTPDCPPPSFACVPRPATCTDAVSCTCLGASFCKFGSCLRAQDRGVSCVGAA